MVFQKEEFRLLWKVYLAEFLRGIGAFIVPFIVIFFQGKSLSLAQIGILLGVVSLTNFFFEIPTGVVADKFGRKNSAILGFIVSYLSFFFMIFTESYPLLILLFFLHGVGFTFTSGAYDGWIYEYLKSKKKEKYMHHFYSRKLGFSYLGLVLSGLIGGFLVRFFDLYWLLFLDTLFGVFFLYFVLQVPDPPLLKEKKSLSYFQIVKVGFRLLRKDRTLLFLTLASVFFTVSVGARELLAQPSYVSLGTPLSYLGYIASLGALLIFLIPLVLLPLSKKYPRSFMVGFAFLEFLLVCSLAFVPGYLLFALLLTLSAICGAIIAPLSESIFQHHSQTEVRATVWSMYQMLLSVVYFIVFSSFGFLADRFGAQLISGISGLFLVWDTNTPQLCCDCALLDKAWTKLLCHYKSYIPWI